MDPSSVYKPLTFWVLSLCLIFKSGCMPSQPTWLTNNFAEYTAQAADWLVLTLVSEFQVPNSDHFLAIFASF